MAADRVDGPRDARVVRSADVHKRAQHLIIHVPVPYVLDGC
jgi:hypothetical protein